MHERVLYCCLVKTYVVNLERAADRRHHMEAQLRRAGLDYEIVTAYEGAALPTEQRELVDEAAVAAQPEWLTPGQVGCSLSHRLAYERMLATADEVALFLEDDVVIKPYVKELLPAIAEHLTGAEVALLNFRAWNVCHFDGSSARELPAGRRLLLPKNNRQPVSAAAYVLTRAAAENLYRGVVPIRAGADSWGTFLDGALIDELWCVLPRPVATKTSFPSTIDYVSSDSRAAQVKALAAHKGAAPLRAALNVARAARERKMSRFVVDD